jgi:uridine kinase
VHHLLDRLDASVLPVDAYYLDRSALPPDERARLNYDEPAAIDLELLVSHVRALRTAVPVARPVYSFTTHTRVGAEPLAPAPVVVVEGLFTLWWESLRSLLDLKIFMDAPADLRLARRIQRDVAERGRTVDSVLEQYVTTVRPMHERYVEPTRAHADLVVGNAGSLEHSVEVVLEAMRRKAR